MELPETPRAKALTRRAYWNLLWETYTPVLALGVLCLMIFLIGASSGLWQRIGDPWRGLTLALAIAAIGICIYRARKVRAPNRSAARRRVEADSGLMHRPLDTVTDTPAGGAGTEIWDQHAQSARRALESATAPRLRPALAPIDKFHLRYAVPAALVLAFMVGAGDNYERLRAALLPSWQHGISAHDASYEAWLDPPAYTARPPSYFKATNRLSAPEDTEFVARISGVKTAPRLIVREGTRTRRITPKRLGLESFEARAVLSQSATASFRIGSKTQSWTIDIGQDNHPEIEFVDPPEAGKRDRLIMSYNLKDDFGAEQLSLVLKLYENPEQSDEIPVALPGRSVREAENEPVALDLTKHKWAGKKVTGYLAAVDGRGQIGTTEAAEFIVTDKIFVEPLAKAIAEQRTFIIADTLPYGPIKPKPEMTIDDFEIQPMFAVDRPDRRIDRAPASVQRAALLIEAVTDRPVGAFDDPAVYMGLRNAYRRIQTAASRADLGGIDEDLWDIALRAEFGRLGDALEDMRRAEEALNSAMARRAPQREIDALFDRYNAAVDRYIEELTLEAIERAKERAANPDGAGGGAGGDMATDQIQELLDAIEEANRMGDTVAARQALAQLAILLENMQIELAEGGGSGGQGVGEGMSEEMREALEELNELLGEQRQLRDETQSAERGESGETGEQQGTQEGEQEGGQPGSGQAGGRSPDQLAEDQAALREMLERLEGGVGALDELSGSAGGTEDKNSEPSGGGSEDGEEGMSAEDIENALRQAERAMRESEEALAGSDFFGAGEAQSRAIDALREAGRGLYAQESRRMAEGEAEGTGDSDETDPFGRENRGSGAGDEVEVPLIDERQRARDLLEELRRRSGEQDRDQLEREYLDRLLEQF